MILLYGIGNYGARYSLTRHNAGVIFLRNFLSSAHILETKILNNAEIFLVSYHGHRALFAFNKGYMNTSGDALKEVLENYSELDARNICVFHDDMDLPLGHVKLKFNGGSGGHKGIDSITINLGTQKFWRLKVGICKPLIKDYRPEWLLQPLTDDELSNLNASFVKIKGSLVYLCSGEWEKAQNLINGSN